MSNEYETSSDVLEFMEAARPVSALAARLAHDTELATNLVHAAHNNDLERMEQIFAAAGVDAVATIDDHLPSRERSATAPTRGTRSWGVTISIGPIHVSIKVEKK